MTQEQQLDARDAQAARAVCAAEKSAAGMALVSAENAYNAHPLVIALVQHAYQRPRDFDEWLAEKRRLVAAALELPERAALLAAELAYNVAQMRYDNTLDYIRDAVGLGADWEDD